MWTVSKEDAELHFKEMLNLVFLFWSCSLDVTTCWLSMRIAAVPFLAWEKYFNILKRKKKKNQEKLNS